MIAEFINEIKSRRKIIVSIVLLVSIFLLLSKVCANYGGSSYLFRFFAVPVMEPCFADLRTITGGAESKKLGFDPMVKNPGDPWNRVMNYPRIWQWLYFFGIDESDTIAIGILFVFLFFCGIYLILPNAPNLSILSTILALLSPAVLLGIERGNTDLFMFFLVALSVFLINKNKYFFSSLVILSAAFFKLFPIFAAVSFLRNDKKRSLGILGIVSAVFVVYLAMTFPDLILISKETPKIIYSSFGKDVLWMKAASINPGSGIVVKYFSYVVLVFFGMSGLFLIFSKSISEKLPEIKFDESMSMDAFRAGAAIYTGTFLIGTNFVYRLMFLIFLIPQIVIWIQSLSGKYKIFSYLTFFSAIWLLYNPMIYKTMRFFSDRIRVVRFFMFFIDDIFAWTLFLCLLFFICCDIKMKISNLKH